MRLQERLENKYIPVTESGCWLWVGAHDRRNGYGSIWVNGRMSYAHRVMYELHVGPIPVSLVIDHICNVKCCVNPSHLRTLSNAENVSRAVVPALACKRGHLLIGENLKPCSKRSGYRCRICAREYERASNKARKIKGLMRDGN